MANYNIKLTANGPSIGSLSCNPGDKITWTNDVAGKIVSLTLPTCVSPPEGTIKLNPVATSRNYTVNNGKGTYQYSYTYDSSIMAVQTGTIDVS